MIEKFGVDVSKREPSKLKHNIWPTTMKGVDGKPIQINNYQTTIHLQRIYPEFLETTAEVVARLLADEAPRAIERHFPESTDQLASLFWPDVHIDKQDIKNTPIKKKSKKVLEATKKLFGQLEMYYPEQINLNILGDFFNAHSNHATTKGTPQQNNAGDVEAWEMGIELNVKAIEWLSSQLPVVARYLRGNHESEKINYLQDVLRYYFLANDNVTIDMSRDELQHYERGKSIIGLNHGDKAKPNDLALMLLQACSRKNMNAEIYAGHKHKNTMESFQGVLVRTL